MVLTLSSEFWATFGLPSNLDYRNTAALESLDFSIHDLHRFLYEVHRVVDLEVLERNVKVFLCKTSLEIGDVEGRMYVAQFRGQI